MRCKSCVCVCIMRLVLAEITGYFGRCALALQLIVVFVVVTIYFIVICYFALNCYGIFPACCCIFPSLSLPLLAAFFSLHTITDYIMIMIFLCPLLTWTLCAIWLMGGCMGVVFFSLCLCEVSSLLCVCVCVCNNLIDVFCSAHSCWNFYQRNICLLLHLSQITKARVWEGHKGVDSRSVM